MDPCDAIYPTPRCCKPQSGVCAVPSTVTIEGPGSDMRVPGLVMHPREPGWIHTAIDTKGVPITGDEAYRLVVDRRGVTIRARTMAGILWGLGSLQQMLTVASDVLPAVIVDDAPAFAVRGFMLDISRDRIPTLASLEALVAAMAGCKLNHLQLYCEHAFAYAGHEAVWRAADPLSPDDLHHLDAVAAAHGVNLCANQNTFGHMERWLRHPAYARLAETDCPWIMPEFGGHYSEPSTLCPLDPNSLSLVADLLAQLAPCCRDPRFNIGCDEPVDLGRGRSRLAVERDGRAAVFSRYVRTVGELCHRVGKRPMFWCDPEPNENDQLSTDLIALVWAYEDDRGFLDRARVHRARGREVWVCPGTANWQTTCSRTANRRGNLVRAAREGRASEANGFLITEWGDRGHLQQWPLTLFGMAEGAQMAWAGGEVFDAAGAGRVCFGDAEVGRWLEHIGAVDEELSYGREPVDGWRRRNTSALGHELHRSQFHEPPRCDERTAWRMVGERLWAIEAPAGIDGVLQAECRYVLDLSRWVADRALQRREGATEPQRMELATRMAALIGEYRTLWGERSRYGGLEDSCLHLRRHTIWW